MNNFQTPFDEQCQQRTIDMEEHMKSCIVRTIRPFECLSLEGLGFDEMKFAYHVS